MTPEFSRRFAFTLHYDGAAFYGWQFLPDLPSVQASVEEVLARLFAREVRIAGSGRTDRGVHATGQVAIVDAPPQWTPAELKRAMNALLPNTVWVAHVSEVAPDFHPRFHALSRSYTYRVGFGQEAESPFRARWCWPIGEELPLTVLRRATAPLVGAHSFRAFAKAGQEHRGDRCIVTSAEWVAWGSIGAEFRITSNRFLHHMVRYIVGTLVDVGLKRRPADDIGRLLDNEIVTSPPAPAMGLFLTHVGYPPNSYDGPDADRRPTPPSVQK